MIAQEHVDAIAAAERGVVAARRQLLDAVNAARAGGASWADVGKVLGISRQAAWERFSGDVI
jgi:hypothetical protein